MSSHEETKLKKGLDEARMRGDLPPEMNTTTGTLINPHIPDFMAKAPWYLTQQQQPTLDHQRKNGNTPVDQSINALESYYRRGAVVNKANTYRKGACKNCGSLTHTEKDCLDRPRKIGAWKTGQNIHADEVILPTLSLGYDAKRDRYAGYNADEHVLTVAKFEANEEERKRIVEETKQKEEEEKRQEKLRKKQEKLAQKEAKKQAKTLDEDAATASEADTTDSEIDSDDSTDYSDTNLDEDREGAKITRIIDNNNKDKDGNAKMSTWNVRVREDTAKYLLNLDTESAFYDPKTRSMRENPLPNQQFGKDTVYAGDNAWKASGMAIQLAQEQLFAWEAAEKGQTDIHLQGNPTQTALLKKQVEERKAAIAELRKQQLLKEYGDNTNNEQNPSHNHQSSSTTAVENIPEELRLGVIENYTEYTKSGQIIRPPITSSSITTLSSSTDNTDSSSSSTTLINNGKSKYPEDIYPGNHHSIYGSWFDIDTKQWGYACCHNTLYSSYCTGQAGIAAIEKSKQRQLQQEKESIEQRNKQLQSFQELKQQQQQTKEKQTGGSLASIGIKRSRDEYTKDNSSTIHTYGESYDD